MSKKIIHVMSNVNMDIIKSFLERELNSISLKTEIFFSGFNQYVQDIINTTSNLYSLNPDYIILFLDGDELFGDAKNKIFFKGTKNAEAIVNEKIENLRELLSIIKLRLNSKILINTIVLNPGNSFSMLEYNNSEKSLINLQYLYNSELSELADSKTIIVDFCNICYSFGYKTLFDQRLWYVGRIKLSHKGLDELARLYISYIKAIEGKVKKCIVLDLDNTLWGGIIGEDGIGGIKLGRDGIGLAFVEFQEELRNLKNQGFLLAINSKNNFDDVKEVFEKHLVMVLKFDDFVSIKINWNDKITNMKEIAEELNIGMDSFIFIDDSDFERELVKKELPMIVVPKFPRDPAYLREWLIDIYKEFLPKVKLSREDIERTSMYKAQVQREQIRKISQSIEDFLESLEMKANIYKNSKTLIPRIAQLTQRTNQFNVTTRRYSEADIQSFIDRDNFILALDLSDRFGPSGVVGVLMIEVSERSLIIDNFLLSCRVIGREVEKAFIGFVINWLGKQDFKQHELSGFYIPTKKNKIVEDVYDRLGFTKVEDNKWIWDIRKEYTLPKFIEIKEFVVND